MTLEEEIETLDYIITSHRRKMIYHYNYGEKEFLRNLRIKYWLRKNYWVKNLLTYLKQCTKKDL